MTYSYNGHKPGTHILSDVVENSESRKKSELLYHTENSFIFSGFYSLMIDESFIQNTQRSEGDLKCKLRTDVNGRGTQSIVEWDRLDKLTGSPHLKGGQKCTRYLVVAFCINKIIAAVGGGTSISSATVNVLT